MASTNKTPNYNLSQFQPTDEPQRVDWNSDMSKIDTAIKDNATNIGLLSSLQNLNDQVTPISGVPSGSALTKSLRTYILNVNITTAFTAGAWKVVANIALGHRPLFNVHTAVLSGSGSVGWLQVSDDGVVSAFFKESASQVVGQILWIA